MVVYASIYFFFLFVVGLGFSSITCLSRNYIFGLVVVSSSHPGRIRLFGTCGVWRVFMSMFKSPEKVFWVIKFKEQGWGISGCDFALILPAESLAQCLADKVTLTLSPG